jgi:hypothetical protein
MGHGNEGTGSKWKVMMLKINKLRPKFKINK